MAELEDDLRQLLARREAPAGFTEKVMARLPRRRRGPLLARWAVAGSLAASLVAGGYFWSEQRRHEQARAMQARDELELSLQITSAKIDKARRLVLQTIQERKL